MKLLQTAVVASTFLAAHGSAVRVGKEGPHKRTLLGLDALWGNVVKQAGGDLTALCQGVLPKTTVSQTATATSTVVVPTTEVLSETIKTTETGRSTFKTVYTVRTTSAGPTGTAHVYTYRRRATPAAGTAAFNALYQLAPAVVKAQCQLVAAKPATTTATFTKTVETTTRPTVSRVDKTTETFSETVTTTVSAAIATQTLTSSYLPNGQFDDGVTGGGPAGGWITAGYGGFIAGTDDDPSHGPVALGTAENLKISDGFVFMQSYDINVVPNTDYTLVLDVKHSAPADPGAANAFIYFMGRDTGTYKTLGDSVTYDSATLDNWTTLSTLQFNSKSATTFDVQIYLAFPGAVDNVRLVY